MGPTTPKHKRVSKNREGLGRKPKALSSHEITLEHCCRIDDKRAFEWIVEKAGDDRSLRMALAYIRNWCKRQDVEEENEVILFDHDIVGWCIGKSDASRSSYKSESVMRGWCATLGLKYDDIVIPHKHTRMGDGDKKVREWRTGWIPVWFWRDIMNDYEQVIDVRTGKEWKDPEPRSPIARFAFQNAVLKALKRTPTDVYRRSKEQFLEARAEAERVCTKVGQFRQANRLLCMIRDRPRPEYEPLWEGQSRRLYDHAYGWGQLRSTVKRALTKDWIHLDLSAAHFSVLQFLVERELVDCPDDQVVADLSLVRTGQSPRSTACPSDSDLDPLKRGGGGGAMEFNDPFTHQSSQTDSALNPLPTSPLKLVRNYVVYGMGEKSLKKHLIGPEVGLSSQTADAVIADTQVQALLRIRRWVFARIKEKGFMVDAYGHRIYVSDMTKKMPSQVLSAVCETYEFVLLHPVLGVLERLGGHVTLYEHDGLSIAHDVPQRLVELRNECIRVVDENAQRLGIPTRFVEKYKQL